MKRRLRLSPLPLIPMLCVLLAACKVLGLEPPPPSFDGRLSAAYTLNTSIRDATDASLNSGVLSSAEAESTLEKTRGFRKSLDTVKAVAQTDLSDAESRLTLLQQALEQLRAELVEKGVEVKP
jgi:hypothetical protein